MSISSCILIVLESFIRTIVQANINWKHAAYLRKYVLFHFLFAIPCAICSLWKAKISASQIWTFVSWQGGDSDIFSQSDFLGPTWGYRIHIDKVHIMFYFQMLIRIWIAIHSWFCANSDRLVFSTLYTLRLSNFHPRNLFSPIQENVLWSHSNPEIWVIIYILQKMGAPLEDRHTMGALSDK